VLRTTRSAIEADVLPLAQKLKGLGLALCWAFSFSEI
jgi:hypothetical protein